MDGRAAWANRVRVATETCARAAGHHCFCVCSTVDEYGEQKSVALSTARRLAEFLGGDMVKDKGLACKLLVAKKPAGEQRRNLGP